MHRQNTLSTDIDSFSVRCSISDRGASDLILAPGDPVWPLGQYIISSYVLACENFIAIKVLPDCAAKDSQQESVPVSHESVAENARLSQTRADLEESCTSAPACASDCLLTQVPLSASKGSRLSCFSAAFADP